MLRIVALLLMGVITLTGCSQERSAENENVKGQARQRKADEAVSGQTPRDGNEAEPSSSLAAQAESAVGEDVGASSGGDAAPVDEGEPESRALAGDAAGADATKQAEVLRWLAQMGSEASIERRAASEALDELVGPGMPAVVQGLREGDIQHKRGAAMYLIGRVSPRDEAAKSALIESLCADDESLRHAALQAVEKMTIEQLVDALPQLVDLAENRDETEAYRSRAIRAITKLGAAGRSATDVLEQLAQHHDESLDVRRACFYGILKSAPGEAAEQFFRTQLEQNETAELRRLAAQWLTRVANSTESLDSLVAGLKDAERSVRMEAVDSLVDIGKPSLPALIRALESPDVQTRRHATLAIGKLGMLATDAVPALKPLLNDPDEQVRKLAAAVLESLPRR